MKKVLFIITFLLVFSGLSQQVYSSEKISSNYTDLIYGGRCQATTQKGAQCKRKAAEGSNYCWQHGGVSQKSNNKGKNDYNKSNKRDNKNSKIDKSSTGETYRGKTVITGSRGGKYYINKNGNKTYIKRKR